MKKGVDFIGVGVGAIIVNNEGKLFLSKRGREVRNESGTWEFPGGGVEFGDTLEATLKREIMEEYGVEIAVGDLLDVCDHIIAAENQHWVSPSYICTIKSGEPKICEPHKCDEIGWFSPSEIQKMNLSLVSKFNFDNYLQKRK
jgi:8-oxo-dGTP diphosphatase